MTQMATAQMLKKNIENQSMAAAVLRLSVGRANAASTAMPGRASIRARSEPSIAMFDAMATSTVTSGTDRWRNSSWRRHCHSVHSASGQAGHRNQAHCRAIESRSPPPGTAVRRRHAPSAVAIDAASNVAATSQGTSRRTSG